MDDARRTHTSMHTDQTCVFAHTTEWEQCACLCCFVVVVVVAAAAAAAARRPPPLPLTCAVRQGAVALALEQRKFMKENDGRSLDAAEKVDWWFSGVF